MDFNGFSWIFIVRREGARTGRTDVTLIASELYFPEVRMRIYIYIYIYHSGPLWPVLLRDQTASAPAGSGWLAGWAGLGWIFEVFEVFKVFNVFTVFEVFDQTNKKLKKLTL